MSRGRLSWRVAAVASVVGLAALSATVALLPPAGTPPAAGAATTPRPNIVFVLTDDLSNNLLPYLPAVQEMQRQGTSLSHYYVVDSLCCPSRTAIFTGQYAHNNGVYSNAGKYGGYGAFNANGDESKSFALALQKAGYRTGFMGKYLNGYRPKYPPPPGWDSWAGVGNGYGEFNYNMNIDGRVKYYGRAPQDYLTDVVSQKAGEFIDSAATTKQPFMLEVSTFAPHRPYTPAPRYAAADSDLTYPRTPAYGRLPDNPPRWLTTRTALSKHDDAEVDGQFRQRVRADLAVNDLIEHLRSVLEAKGLADNTYFVFSSDNGYHMGEHRLMPGKQTAFDTDINVPLVVTGPGVPAGRVVDQLASNIDLAPTFETLAGADIPATVDGVSLTPLLQGRTPQRWQQAVLVEHHHPGGLTAGPDLQPVRAGAPPSYTAVRTLGALYVRYADGSQEYYDTTSDPDELHNLAGDGIPPALLLTLDQLKTCHGTTACQGAALQP